MKKIMLFVTLILVGCLFINNFVFAGPVENKEVFQNFPPEAPTIEGPHSKQMTLYLPKPGEPQDFTFVSKDPEGHKIFYFIDWDDGTYIDWIGPYDSGKKITISHTFSEMGDFSVRAKAKDIFGLEGPWGTTIIPLMTSENMQQSSLSCNNTEFISKDSSIKSITFEDPVELSDPILEWNFFEENGTLYLSFFIIIYNISDMDRAEMYINDGLYETVEGGGPEFSFTIEWSSGTIKRCTFTFIIYFHSGKIIEIRLEPVTGLLFGRVENHIKFLGMSVCNAIKLRLIQFLPFSYTMYSSGEKIALLYSQFKILTDNFICGFFTMLFGKVTISYQY